MKYFALLLIILFPSNAFAAVSITFVETGSPTANDEYIVIKNTGNSAQDISSWSLQAKNTSSATIQKKNFTSGSVIAPGGEYIIAHKEGRFASQAQMTYSSLALSGSGGMLALHTSQTYVSNFQEPSISSTYAYGQTTTTPSTSETSNQTGTAPPTPKAVSSVPEFIGTIKPQEKNWPIQINELFPRPNADQEEYIEIINTSATGIDVSGLWLRDASGAKYALGSRGENSMLGAYETRAWKRSVTRIALNDTDGEVIMLADQNGTIVDRAIYTEDCETNTAYARFKNSWLWTQLATPSQINYLTRLQIPPIARAVIPQLPLTVNEKILVSAEDSSDENDSIVNYQWKFGDGAESFGVTSTHTFATSGTFIIALTVTDSFGATSSVSRSVVVQGAPLIAISAATTRTTSTPAIKKAITPKKANANPRYTGVVTVPPGILGKRKFVVNGRTVDVTSNRIEIPRLERGAVVSFTASEVFRTDRLIQQINSKDMLQITALTTAPPYDMLRGEITQTSKTGFTLMTSSTNYNVIAGTKYPTGERIQIGDTVEMSGVLLRDDTETPYFLIPNIKQLTLLKQAISAANSQRNNILMLSVSIGLLVLLQMFLSRYGRVISTKVKNVVKKNA